jgi:hypothetical protein
MSANPAVRPKGLDEEILLARYKENCDQARQHENLRERTTAMIAATVGVLLGFLGLKASGSLPTGPLVPIMASFIVLLGAFGVFASWLFDNRARMHRATIDNIEACLKCEMHEACAKRRSLERGKTPARLRPTS